MAQQIQLNNMGKELERGNFPDCLLRMVLHFECLSKKSVDGDFECRSEVNTRSTKDNIKESGVGLSIGMGGCGGTGLSRPGPDTSPD
ncbi:hypothetical protein Tco_1275102 [Tanacetum coccineum]